MLGSLVPVSCDADPFSEAFFANPFAAHEALRDAGAVIYLTRYDVWAVTRWADVRAALQDAATFCSSRGVGMQDWARDIPWRPPSLLLEADPPTHDHARGVINRVLSPQASNRLRGEMVAVADQFVASLLTRGTFDAVPDLAESYPLRVFSDAVGLPEEGRENLLPYANAAFNTLGPCNRHFEAAVAEARSRGPAIAKLCARETLRPGGFGAELYAAADAGDITAGEAALLIRSLLSAGFETTVSALAAALYCLARQPEQFAALRADPLLARAAFDEAIRMESPIQALFRTTTRPVDIGGTMVPEGAKLLIMLASANRDPRRWNDPDRYDITRTTAGHVGFGGGVHACVGLMMARMEGTAVLDSVARMVGRIEIVGDVTLKFNNTLRKVGSLPVRVSA